MVGEVDAALLRNADEPTVGKALVVGRVVQYSQNLINDINMVGRCKLDPSLKATCFQPLNLRVHKVLST